MLLPLAVWRDWARAGRRTNSLRPVPPLSRPLCHTRLWISRTVLIPNRKLPFYLPSFTLLGTLSAFPFFRFINVPLFPRRLLLILLNRSYSNVVPVQLVASRIPPFLFS